MVDYYNLQFFSLPANRYVNMKFFNNFKQQGSPSAELAKVQN